MGSWVKAQGAQEKVWRLCRSGTKYSVISVDQGNGSGLESRNFLWIFFPSHDHSTTDMFNINVSFRKWSASPREPVRGIRGHCL